MFVIVLVFTVCINSVNATGILGNLFNQAQNFKGNETKLGSGISEFIDGNIKPIVSAIGNLIFAGVTVILGAKYIWSGYDGKSKVKETLPTFVVAVLIFYLADSITDLFFDNNAIRDTLTGDYDSIAKTVIATVNLVVKYVSLAGIVFIGLRYMFESAEGKAKIKDKLVPMVLGIVLVFCASQFVDFIINSGTQIITQ